MRRRAIPIASLATILVVVGCADPCEDSMETPTLEIGGADADLAFEPFAPGADRELVRGLQGGMHVWLHARMRGMCPDTTTLDRRVLNATGDLAQLGLGHVDFVETDADGTYELVGPLPMQLCPPVVGPVVDEPFAFRVVAEDSARHRAEAELPFVPRCPIGMDCSDLCSAP